ncbi:MAG: helix-turn-helix domain-containing protein [Dehalococcoidia bacterium]|nr:helix-turn-helix domain-containing protein [Dehalococcoidia bacterium]
MTSAKNSCSVCEEELTPQTEAFCNNCGQPYHLNHRQDAPGKDCGQVWINEEHLSLEFACDRCLHPDQYEGGLDDVLDLAEAAAATGVSEASLAAAADGGELPHRKTGSGVYLFQRRDLPAQQGRR